MKVSELTCMYLGGPWDGLMETVTRNPGAAAPTDGPPVGLVIHGIPDMADPSKAVCVKLYACHYVLAVTQTPGAPVRYLYSHTTLREP